MIIIDELYFDKDFIKNNLSIHQIADLVTSFGANPTFKNDEVLMMETICHNQIGESHGQKLYYYDNTKLFKCYTECDTTFDIFELVCKVKKIQNYEDWSLYRAICFVAGTFGFAPTAEANDGLLATAEDLRILNYYDNLNKNRDDIIFDYKVYDEKILDCLPFIPSIDWLREGITIDTMKRYGIKYYGTEHKIVIPHYDYKNNLIGIRGRTLVREEAELFGKYMPLKINGVMYNHPLSYNLYGLNMNLENIRKAKRIFLFEGEKSVMLYDSFFGKENNIAVATCGHSVTLPQINLIKTLCDVDEIILAYDKQFQEIGDKDFEKDTKLLTNLANKMNNYCVVSIMFDKFGKLDFKDSPIDKGKDTFEFLFANRIVQGA